MKILSFDIESCNGNPREASLCSFGYVISDENFNIIEKKDILVNPVPKKFTLGNAWGKGIKLAYPEKQFRKSPLFVEIYEQIEGLFKSADLVIGFSIINDLNYLNCACCYYSLHNFDFSFVDVQDLYAILHNGEHSSLDKIMKNYGVDFEVHRSDEDAFVTLILLKKICEETGKSVEELLNYYGIVKGHNGMGGYKISYSLAQMTEKYGLKRTSKLNKYLFLKHIEKKKKIKGELKGKRFHFSRKLISSDLDLCRNLINAIYQKGGIYSLSLEETKVFVSLEGEQLENGELAFYEKQKADFITLSELNKIVGEYQKEFFNDTEQIKKFFNKKTHLLT